MVVLVIGLGSMGKRRIRLITQNFKGYTVAGVDGRSDRRREAASQFGIQVYPDLDTALSCQNSDVAFISTSPESHPQLILKCLESRLHVFTEINLIDINHRKLFETAEINNLELFVSSTPMYRKEIEYIKENVNNWRKKEKCRYMYHVGQYLPDWHTWESYKDFFVAEKQTNGCREILAIELPWIIKTFGKIINKIVRCDTISSLELKYPDSFIMILEHEGGHQGVLTVDVVSRKAVRNLEIFSENLYLSWNGSPNGLCVYDTKSKSMPQIDLYEKFERDDRYADNIIEDAYLAEIKLFFSRINCYGQPSRYTIMEESDTLKIIDEIEGI